MNAINEVTEITKVVTKLVNIGTDIKRNLDNEISGQFSGYKWSVKIGFRSTIISDGIYTSVEIRMTVNNQSYYKFSVGPDDFKSLALIKECQNLIMNYEPEMLDYTKITKVINEL